MADVYENSVITIAATCSRDSDQGCVSRAEDGFMASPIQKTGLFVRKRKHLFPQPWETRLDDDLWPLLDRAWVFQERALSPRVIHLAREQLYWECETLFIAEDGCESSSEGYDYSLKRSTGDSSTDWLAVIEHYACLNLTIESDRLPAISAFVKRVQPLRKGDTLACNWNAGTTSTYNKTPELVLGVQLIEVNYTITGPAHMGSASNASITLMAPCTTVKFSTFDCFEIELQQDPFILGRDFDSFRDIIEHQFQSVDFDYRTADHPMLPGQELIFLLLWESKHLLGHEGIVLRLIGKETYERVGWVRFAANSLDADRLKTRLKEFVDLLPIKQFKIV
ncbi:hypothetical protein E8E12_006479 [Didymella heteroderae]|uniref:Uncharacterized protein n=1 Tax=Didymella heteroderae TaxID=1769908 RepID=A0A9P5BZS7_9PLEO|nr:hypothetical protein E8E12_006479 [Didymella heteroderae]